MPNDTQPRRTPDLRDSLSLDYNNIPKRTASTWDRKTKRTYGRLMSGVKRAFVQSAHLQFITLTTSDEAKDRSLMRDFQNLVKRIRRQIPFEYCKVTTKEGNGVIHLLCKGNYCFLHSWLSAQWQDLHLSYIVWVRQCRGSLPRLVRYLLKYFGHHTSSHVSWSKRWLWHGWLTQFKELLKTYGFTEGLKYWNNLINTYNLVNLRGKQIGLT